MSDINARRRTPLTKTLIWDVAREAGVSIATVSRALNGRADVAAVTRENVLRIAQEKGYAGPQRAQSARRMMGLVTSHVSSFYFAEIMQGAIETVETYASNLVIYSTEQQSAGAKSLLKRLRRDGVDSALLLLPTESQAELLHLQQHGYPFVIVDPTYPVSERMLVVAAANMAGGRQATEHLIALGHRRVGVITGPFRWCATIDRLAGYHAVLTGIRLPVEPTLEVEGDFSVEGGFAAAQKLLALSEPPTAIFAFNDLMAVGTLRAAEERGLRVPEDLSIIGFDDAVFASYTTPALTTVYQPLRELGRAGIGLLFRQLQGQPIEARRIELSTRLVVRASTGPAPQM